MTMTEKFKILAKYIKDMSSETPDVETYMSAGNNMGKYQLDIDIKSIALKNKRIEVNITLKFQHKDTQVKKSHFEIIYAVAVKIDESIKEKKDLEKLINMNKYSATESYCLWKILCLSICFILDLQENICI